MGLRPGEGPFSESKLEGWRRNLDYISPLLLLSHSDNWGRVESGDKACKGHFRSLLLLVVHIMMKDCSGNSSQPWGDLCRPVQMWCQQRTEVYTSVCARLRSVSQQTYDQVIKGRRRWKIEKKSCHIRSAMCLTWDTSLKRQDFLLYKTWSY